MCSINRREFFVLIEGFDFLGLSKFNLNKNKYKRGINWLRASELLFRHKRRAVDEIRKTKKT